MNYKLLDNIKDISEAFVSRFILSWEEFQVDLKDFIAEMEKDNHPVDYAFYEQSYFWDRMGSRYPYVSMKEALAFLREHSGPVYFMGEKGENGSGQGKRIVDFIAEADSHSLAEKIEQEWYESYRLAMQYMYNPDVLLPEDLYVFDASMKWCVVFTHEITDLESQFDEPMKAAESRVCIICKDENS